jgi:hypothetical protein
VLDDELLNLWDAAAHTPAFGMTELGRTKAGDKAMAVGLLPRRLRQPSSRSDGLRSA